MVRADVLWRGVLACVMLMGLSGCIVEDIHTEMQTVNKNLLSVENRLVSMNSAVRDVEIGLDQTNSRLRALDIQLAEIESGLDQTNERLGSLDEIETSLASLDAHLAAIRAIVRSLDETIPFLSFGGDDEEEEDAEGEGVQPEEDDAGTTGASGGDDEDESE